jgi:hypothetical protein
MRTHTVTWQPGFFPVGKAVRFVYKLKLSEILGFRTLSIVLVFKKQTKETRRFGNWICFRPQVREKPILLGPLERRNHWTC